MSKPRFRIQSAGLEIQDLGILRIQILNVGLEIQGKDILRIQSAGLRIVEFRPWMLNKKNIRISRY